MRTRSEKNKNLINEEKKIKRDNRKKFFKKVLIVFLIIILLIVLYGFLVEPKMLRVNEEKIVSSEIPDSFHGVKIVHFSDLHYGSTINKNNIDKIVDKINLLKPDILIFTGDLIDNKYKLSKDDAEVLSKSLKKMNATLGKYSILGNHDFYVEEIDNIYFDSSFDLLVNEGDLVYYKENTPILIYGVDDMIYGKPSIDPIKKDEYSNIPYKILLTHEGDFINSLGDYKFNLILAGHSHNGQVNIFKPVFLPEYSKHYYDNFYEKDGTLIYVSNGIGCSILPFRLGSIPSINLYRLNTK